MLIFWTILIAILTAVACSICGVYLVVKRETFLSEGLSHAVLPGILVAFLVFQDRTSPWLIITAGLSGLVMVWLVQLITNTKLVEKDAALGIVFSGLFSIGVILSRLNLKNVHFHADCIIDGNLEYAPLKGLSIGGYYLGPQAFVTLLTINLLLIGFVGLFYKEMKLNSFDQSTSKLLGFRPNLLHTAWLAIVSITCVAAFEIAGTILVVALIIAPPTAANLLVNRLSQMLVVSALLGAFAAIIGVAVGLQLDIAASGPIAATSGFLFLLIVLVAPKRGIISRWQQRAGQRARLLETLVLTLTESKPIHQLAIVTNIQCPPQQVQRAISRCRNRGLVQLDAEQMVSITNKGSALIELRSNARDQTVSLKGQ